MTPTSEKRGFDFGVIKAIRHKIKQSKIDILHCHQYTPWVYGTLASIGTGTKVIFTEHGRFYPDVKHPKRQFVNPLLSLLTSKITAISRATAQALQDFEYIPLHKVKVIYNGINAHIPKSVQCKRDELDISPETLVVGSIARFDPIKNHLMMIESIKSLIDRNIDVHLILVGDGECRGLIESRISEYNLQEHVTLPGYISKPFDYLNAMDIFLLTSYSEGTSMTLLEAMRAGKPCIVTNVGGNPEVILDGKNGIVIESDNSAQLNDAVVKLYKDKSLYSDMSTNTKLRFSDVFTTEKMLDEFSSIYESIE